MVRNDYKCPVCGKVLKIAGPRNIELHEKSQFHVAAMKQDNDIVPKSTDTGIQTTVLEGNNDTHKETGEQTGEQTNDNGNWDGYLC